MVTDMKSMTYKNQRTQKSPTGRTLVGQAGPVTIIGVQGRATSYNVVPSRRSAYSGKRCFSISLKSFGKGMGVQGLMHWVSGCILTFPCFAGILVSYYFNRQTEIV